LQKNNKLFLVFMVLVLSLIFTGCQPKVSQKPGPDNMNRTRTNVGNNTNINNKPKKGIGTTDMRNTDLSKRADRIAKNVTKLNDVNSTTVVISGNTALVGVDIKDNVEGKITNNLKRRVEKTVRDTDKNITNVSITADADLYRRISNMATDIKNGRPISGFANEIQEILRRITPSK
jgi:YhcN/YlaJ family sporulation lipoprotein